MKRQSKLKIFICLLTGFLLCVMVTMMYIGRKVNFKEFSSAGRVYDFSQKQLKESGRKWQYDAQAGVYRIQGNKSGRKFLIDGSVSSWGYLYINVDTMSLPSMEAGIVYRDRNDKVILEQPIILVPGENTIVLDENVPMYRMGIKLYNADGQFISFYSMQLRQEASGFLPGRIVKIFAVSYGGFLAVVVLLWVWRLKRPVRRRKGKLSDETGKWVSCLQYAYRLLLEDTARNISNKFGIKRKNFWRKLLFCFLFLWIVLGNVNDWFVKIPQYKCTVLVSSIILVVIAIFCWEGPRGIIKRKDILEVPWLRLISWKTPVALSWLCLWIWTMISDVTALTSLHFAGYAMVFGCGLLIYAWNNMESPSKLLYEMMEALEIDFGVAVLYCMVCRTKKLAIQYNGIFKSSEEFSAYSLLMLAVFMVEIDGLLISGKRWYEYFRNITGAAVALFFVIRAGNTTGYVAAALVLGIFVIRELCRGREERRKWKKVLLRCVSAGIAAFCVVCVVHVSTKYLPVFLGMEVNYQNETLLTNVSQDMMEAFEQLQPGLMKHVAQQDSVEVDVYQKAYIRKWSLWGNGQAVWVFRKQVPAYSGYIQMAYRYGIFILVPYIVLQISMLGKGFRSLNPRRKIGRDGNFCMFLITIIFICFCIRGNLEYLYRTPLWLTYYLGAGYWFPDNRENNGRL